MSETSPTPTRCPRCKCPGISKLGTTPTGLVPWRCSACRIIGYGDRIVGDPVADAPRAKRGRPSKSGSRFVRKPAKAIRPEDVP